MFLYGGLSVIPGSVTCRQVSWLKSIYPPDSCPAYCSPEGGLDAEKGKYDNNLSELVSAGREMFRLEKLELIARNKIRTLREVNKIAKVDEIEVYLGYQNKLKKPLELSSVTAEMQYFDVSDITEPDLRDAEIRVKIDENLRFREWILQWAPLHSVLKRTNPEDWETLCEKKTLDYENTFRMLSDTELPNELVGDDDAERAVGV
ncbi:TPA: hypothetical protein PC598_001383 [Morganella morganii]|nr:hypothetical protein [Morganella morganii]